LIQENSFSAQHRANDIQRLENESFDLLVIGGGITGAGIALDAASRGLSVALFEKEDFASGTSSKSTKLIHGGLRYLKQLEIGLVKEVGRERAILHHNAPHLVHPEDMLLPILEDGSLGTLTTSMGLKVYDWLAQVNKDEKRQMLSVEETLEKEPLLSDTPLEGGAMYKEYRTDDARLVIEVLKTAIEKGAQAFNYCEVTSFEYDEQGKAIGLHAKDRLEDKTFSVQGSKIVNATGPWVDELRKRDQSLNNKQLHLTKGIHLVVPHKAFPLHQSIYFDVSDDRMVFGIPRGDVTYIGTTDTNYNQDLDHPATKEEDAQYLLDAVNAMFPSIHLRIDDVTSSWAGLRPLIHEEGKDPSELSRKDEMFTAPSGIISIAGGKLTGYRKMAERVVDSVAEHLEQEGKKVPWYCITDQIALVGGRIPKKQRLEDYIDFRAGESKQISLKRKQVEELVFRYGTAIEDILEIAFDLHPEIKDHDERILYAELRYTVLNEMTTTLNDFLIRRTGMLYFNRERAGTIYKRVAGWMANLLKWSHETMLANIEAFEDEYYKAVDFRHKQAQAS